MVRSPVGLTRAAARNADRRRVVAPARRVDERAVPMKSLIGVSEDANVTSFSARWYSTKAWWSLAIWNAPRAKNGLALGGREDVQHRGEVVAAGVLRGAGAPVAAFTWNEPALGMQPWAAVTFTCRGRRKA